MASGQNVSQYVSTKPKGSEGPPDDFAGSFDNYFHNHRQSCLCGALVYSIQ